MSDETWVVTLPKLGESVTEGVIGSVFKHVGDEVEFDDALFEVSTDKVDTEVPSSYDGVVLEVLAQEGDTVAVGAAIMRIGGKGTPVANRLPSAAHGVAAAGGRSLNDASAPSVGGSEGPTTEGADFSPSATGEVFEITMPKLGESVTEGTIGTWFKAVGDAVELDDVLFDVSTDKVDSEIPSPYDGTILAILVNAGDTVPVGTVLARIGAAGSATGGSPATARYGRRQQSGRQRQRASRRGGARPRIGGPRRRRWRTSVVALGASARRRERHRRGDRSRGRAPVGGSGVRTSMTAVAAAKTTTAATAARRQRRRPRRGPGSQGGQGRARRSDSAEQDAADPGGHPQGVTDAGGIGVDLGGSGFRQHRPGARRVQGAIQEGDRCVAELPAVHLSGGMRSHCAHSRRSTRRSTSKPRR